MGSSGDQYRQIEYCQCFLIHEEKSRVLFRIIRCVRYYVILEGIRNDILLLEGEYSFANRARRSDLCALGV